jgi:4-deoxy-L-threo-5-hexosulose-uronate ketol-isomerase
MKILHAVHPNDFRRYDTAEIRERFLLEGLVAPGGQRLAYSYYDRLIVGAVAPLETPILLDNPAELKAEYVLERRELGVVNIGGAGKIIVDGQEYRLEKVDCLYIGQGSQSVQFASEDKSNGARFMLFSAPAHKSFPTRLMRPAEALPAELGSLDNNNHRVINKYIHNDGIQSCQLVLGVTHFQPGSIWNTMPPHTHGRRMEAYFYFDLPANQRIVHFMGEPQETRHMFLSNEQGIISPPWSIHSGVATAPYSFIWAMAGENKVFTDMDAVGLQELM